MQYIYKYDSPMGMITIASNGESLTGLWFNGQKYFAGTLEKENEAKQLPVFKETRDWLDIYFTGKDPGFTPPLYMNGSKFRMAVWKILCEIPFGKIITYGGIAKQIAAKHRPDKMSAQAVGGAVGHNPISIIVPCHRVIGANGNLTGYAGGIGTKVKLLTLEGLDMTRFCVPTKGTAL
ncbi:MAG: methylated-DNA-[protein]-cysteine S-methyltransferase [Candidatus Desulfovibrio kirbyi]|uniref:Methylated-DNA--protein-cysteine methyltransferase n=1 Tax=Candidatus Desulfovibrio kirbyi TaxID=2696086 RepID=A0A6L2R671_9BACT|nr:MAG: methylated-DNA-[protein]-cysteine S-methyltransferase [Candidatus Desulfovibrio kirbyi]